MKNTLEEIIVTISERAVEYAKSFNVEFTYAEDDVTYLEGILEIYSEDLTKGKPTDSQLHSMSFIWGIYLGQLMRLHVNPNLSWVKEDVFGDGEVIHLSDQGTKIFPIEKIYNRLVNGKEDNVISFFEAVKEEFTVPLE